MTWKRANYVSYPTVRRFEGGKIFTVTSAPPIWSARVRSVSATRWRVSFQGPKLVAPESFPDAHEALQRASALVGMLSGEWWRAHLSGAQRIMIGRERRCPYDMSPGLCGQLPGAGSVWCEAHPWGQA